MLYNIHMRLGIYTNVKKDADCVFTKKLIDFLKSEEVFCSVHKSLSHYFTDLKTFSKINSSMDMCIAIGGDGTILSIAAECANACVPILGFNCGHVGFLSEGEPDDFTAVIKKVLCGGYTIEKRSMLACTTLKKKICALNDFVISREEGKLIAVDVYSGERFIDSHYCDGFIVSTPTGSTAYSLSAGGPVISPAANVIALTPINSHTLHSRPIVINDTETITLKLSGESDKAKIFADGNCIAGIKSGDEIGIVKADCEVSFVRLPEYNFYEKLLCKLNKWGVVSKNKEQMNAENQQTK